MYTAAEARAFIEGIAPVINTVQRQFIASAQAVLGLDADYLSVAAADRLLSATPEDAPLEAIREAYRAYFIDGDGAKFDKTLYHFLLNRLGKHADRFALAHSLTMLASHPEETKDVLAYVKRVRAEAEAEPALVAFLRSSDCIYPYQVHSILDWLIHAGHAPGDELLQIIREKALGPNVEWYVAATARALLGAWGTPADFERLEALYAETADPLEQARILCSLKRMETGRRNAFLARTQRDGDWQSRAARLVRR